MKETYQTINTAILITILLIVSAALRFYGIGDESLRNDELSSWQRSNASSIHEVIENTKGDVHPPGYHLLLYYVIQYFGDSEVALRVPSAIAGVLAILLIYLMGKRLYSNEVGLTVAAILAISWHPIYYAQDARAYSLLLLITLACSYLFFELMISLKEQRSPNRAIVIGYVVSAAMACYLHYFGLLLVALQGFWGVVILMRYRVRTALYLLSIYVGVVALYAPWIPSMFEQMGQHQEFWIKDPLFLNTLGALFIFSYLVPIWFGFLFLAPAYLYFTVKMARNVIGGKEVIADSRQAYADLFLIIWIAAPFLAAYIQSKVSTPVLTLKNLIIVLPPIYLVLSRILCEIPWMAARRTWFIVIMAGIFYFFIGHFGYYDSIKKAQFRDAAQFVIEHDKDLPVVAFTWHEQYYEYYFEKFGSKKKVGLIAGLAQDVPQLEAFLAESKTHGFWYIAGHREPDKKFLAYLNSHYNLMDIRLFKKASVRLYRLP